jgi:hypothetical protein
MSDYLSNRKRNLNIGIKSYTENLLVLDVIGNTNITGLSTIGNVEIRPGIITASSGIITYYGDGSKLININSSTSNYSNISGVSTYATNAGVSTYATNAGVSTFATNAGVSTFATNAGIATYATNAGIATYSDFSGIATYSNISGLATALQNPRTFEITGDIVASPIFFDGTQNVAFASTIQPNSVELGTDTYGDYVQSISGTANQIDITGGTGESSTPIVSIALNPLLPGNVTVQNDLQVNNNLNVTGNITIGGTSAYLIVNDFRVKDKDIILGFTTDSYNNDASTDVTANHGGISVASTEGNPLVQLYNPSLGETTPATYKKIMWFKAGSFAGLNTDAWLFNYGVGIGSTQIPNRVRLAVGGVQVTDSDILNVNNINSSGIISAFNFVGNLTGTATTSTNVIGGVSSVSSLNVSGISTLGALKISAGIVTATTGVITYYGDGSKLTGISATAIIGITSYADTAGIATSAIGGIGSLLSLNVSGISTLGALKISAGIVTATTGVITYYGDGSKLTGISATAIIGITSYADTAGISSYSNIAGYALVSGIATYSLSAGIATYAVSAGIVSYANASGIATYATTAGISSYATSSGIATYAVSAGIVSYATTAGVATYAPNAGIATYATTAGVATYAPNAGIATYATTAGVATYATSSGIATYATTAGISTVSQGLTGSPNITVGIVTASSFIGNLTGTATTANYSVNSGIASYANTSGVSTNAIGGIASVTSLSVSGISTLGTVQVSSGIISATSGIVTYYGDGSNLININSGSISGTIQYAANSGIASYANIAGVTTALQNSRTFEITGDIIASPVTFNGTGNVSLAATIQPNSVGLGTDTTGDYIQSISGTTSQISITGGMGEGSTPIVSIASNPTLPGNVTIGNDLQVNRNLNVTGNITIGGTTAFIIVNDFRVKDADIILGFTTDSNGNDVSNDTTANHGGLSVASTEGTPLVQIYNPALGEVTPATYKKIMWFKAGSFAGQNEDAWLINYAVGIGSTQFPAGTILAAGAVQFSEKDLKVVRNINASGIITATKFVGNLTGVADTATNLSDAANITTGTINSARLSGFYNISVPYSNISGVSTNVIGGIGSVTNLTVSGISTLGTVQISSGIVTASTGIVTYYGDGKGLINIRASSITGITTYAATAGIATLAQGLTGVPNIVVGIVTATDYYGNFRGTLNSDVVANYSANSGIATYATNAGIATYATNADVSTYATNAGVSTFATNAGIATYATNADVSTNVIGGIGSISSLSVSGVSTLGSVLVSSGIVTATSGIITYYGDGQYLRNIISGIQIQSNTQNTNQYLTYSVSIGTTTILGITSSSLTFNPSTNKLGIGTTNPTSSLYVVGDTLITGILTANRIISSVYGEFTGGTVSGTNIVGTSLSVSGISTLSTIQISSGIITATSGIVTYYGDGSKLSGLIPNSVQNVNINSTYYPLLSPVISGTISSISLSGSSLVFNPGLSRLGIGSTSPTVTLDIAGSSNISGNLNVGFGGTIISTTSLGLVGFGTTNPSQEVHIQGDIRVTGAYYDSTNSPGVAGQVLQSTASGTQWATATAGGSGKFDTSIDNVLYVQPTGTLDVVGVGTTTTQITTFPAGSNEYIIHSIHVTNVSNGDAEITAGFVMNAKRVPASVTVGGGPGIHTITVGSASSIVVGMAVTGTGNIGETVGIGSTAGLQYNTYVTSVDSNIITLSKPLSGIISGTASFTPVSKIVSRLPIPVGSAVELLKQPFVLNALDSIALQSTGAGSGIGSTSTAAISQTSGSNFLTVTAGTAITSFIAAGQLINGTSSNTGIQTNTYVGVGYTPGSLSVPMTRPATSTLASQILSFTETVVPQDGALQVTLVYQSTTDLTYNNGVGLAGTVSSVIYGTGPTYPGTVQSIRVANVSDSGDYPVWVAIGNTDTIFSYLAYNMTIPKNSSIELCEAPKRLGIGQSIFAFSDTANVIEVQVAGKLKTS